MNSVKHQSYYFQKVDIYQLCRRITEQLNIARGAYRDKTKLLEETIRMEWINFHVNASNAWTQQFKKLSDDFEQKEKYYADQKEFFVNELIRIKLDYEELMRTMRLHLAKDKENLELELRQYKTKVLLDSDKLLYNHYVLQQQNNENVLILSEERRNLAKLQAKVISSRKELTENKATFQSDLQKLNLSISKLIASIQLSQRNILASTESNHNTVSKPSV